MKNLEKQQFFALYWGQEVLKSLKNNGNYGTYPVGFGNSYYNELDYLELKPLSKISDEDAIEVTNFFGLGHLFGSTKDLIKSILESISNKQSMSLSIATWLSVLDFLRSKGYALPWREYSIEKLVELNIIKLV